MGIERGHRDRVGALPDLGGARLEEDPGILIKIDRGSVDPSGLGEVKAKGIDEKGAEKGKIASGRT